MLSKKLNTLKYILIRCPIQVWRIIYYPKGVCDQTWVSTGRLLVHFFQWENSSIFTFRYQILVKVPRFQITNILKLFKISQMATIIFYLIFNVTVALKIKWLTYHLPNFKLKVQSFMNLCDPIWNGLSLLPAFKTKCERMKHKKK